MKFKFKKIIADNIFIYLLEYDDYDLNEFLYILNKEEIEKIETFKSESRKKEFVAVRILKQKYLKKHSIKYNKNGAPIIDKGFISISHTKNIVGIAYNKNHVVGLDIEYERDNIKKISPKFLSEKEITDLTVDSNFEVTKIWSFKEVLYKIANLNGIDFKHELKISKISDQIYLGEISNNTINLNSKLSFINYKDLIITFNISNCE